MKNFLSLILKKIYKNIAIFCYSLPFGLKAADNEIFFSKNTSSSDLDSTHIINLQNSIGMDLLRGEVTQDVEDLRYSTYVVDRESTNYLYIGEGKAKKIERNISNENINMGIKIEEITKDVLSSIKDYENNYDTGTSYTVNFEYDDFPIYQLNRIANYLKVVKNKKRNECLLFFELLSDEFDISKRKFISHLRKIYEDKTNSLDRAYRLMGKPNKISFVTYKSDNEYDLIKYEISGLHVCDILCDNGNIIVKMLFENIDRVDLIEKFYSERQDKRYKEKEIKNNTYYI